MQYSMQSWLFFSRDNLVLLIYGQYFDATALYIRCIPDYKLQGIVKHKVLSDCSYTYISVKIPKMLLIFVTHHVRIIVIGLCFSLSGHHISCCHRNVTYTLDVKLPLDKTTLITP